MRKSVYDVFGLSNEILTDSYFDRGNLDKEISHLINAKQVIAIRGASKSGKSWLRQKAFPNALVVQCRFGYGIENILTDALAQLDVRLRLEETTSRKFGGTLAASTGTGLSLLLKASGKGEASTEDTLKFREYGRDITDLKFIADIINVAKRKLVIEDFHYLDVETQKRLAFDLKSLWDHGCFAVVVGVWGRHNLLTTYNPDLSLRCTELQVEWTDIELRQVVVKGCKTLKIELLDDTIDGLVANSFGNSGLLQTLTQRAIVIAGLVEEQPRLAKVSTDVHHEACRQVANQLNATYQTFAERVASGIRSRKKATGIYAHAMASIVNSPDIKLTEGLSVDDIYLECHQREPRIQKANLKSILRKIDGLQIDAEGRGLVITYNHFEGKIITVDRQLLFYRTHCTVNWPWHDIIQESEHTPEQDYCVQLSFEDY